MHLLLEEEEEEEEEATTIVHIIGMGLTREMWNAIIVTTLGITAMNVEQNQAMKLVSK